MQKKESEAESDENLFERQLVDKERDEKICQRTQNRARRKPRTQVIPQRKRYSGENEFTLEFTLEPRCEG